MLHELTARDIVQTNVEVLELLRVEIINLLGDVQNILDAVQEGDGTTQYTQYELQHQSNIRG